jgi:hypothetical protein
VIQYPGLTIGKGEMPHRPLARWLRPWLRISVRGLIVLVLFIGAGHLKTLIDLKFLSFRGTQSTGAGLAHLEGLIRAMV